jgi:hypothetical protein
MCTLLLQIPDDFLGCDLQSFARTYEHDYVPLIMATHMPLQPSSVHNTILQIPDDFLGCDPAPPGNPALSAHWWWVAWGGGAGVLFQCTFGSESGLLLMCL